MAVQRSIHHFVRQQLPAAPMDNTGTLSIVATPIGNLEDITIRAINALKNSDLILCEDTRKTSILCKHYEIATTLKSFRIHRLKEDLSFALNQLQDGKKIALVSDAGTPGISDPGSHLVREVRNKLPEVKIEPVPGPSALACALSLSGWQVNPTIFLGFLSIKSAKRKKQLQHYSAFAGTIVLYESVHRIIKVLHEIREIFPEREILLAREMTKHFEEYRLIQVKQQIPDNLTTKGEFTVLIGPEKTGD